MKLFVKGDDIFAAQVYVPHLTNTTTIPATVGPLSTGGVGVVGGAAVGAGVAATPPIVAPRIGTMPRFYTAALGGGGPAGGPPVRISAAAIPTAAMFSSSNLHHDP